MHTDACECGLDKDERLNVIDRFSREYFYEWKRGIDSICLSDIIPDNAGEIKTIGSYFHRLKMGGTERVVAHLAGIWMSLGYSVIIITDEEPDENDYALPDGVTRVVLPDARKIRQNDYVIRQRQLSRVIEEYNIDLIVYHAWISNVLLWDMLTCKACGAYFVVHCHNIFSEMAIHDPVLFINMPYAYALADGIVVLSRNDASFWSNFNRNVFETINPMQYSCVDEIPLSPLNGRTVIWCQRFSPEKNPRDAIEIFGMVHDMMPDAHFMVLGKGLTEQDDDDIRAFARESGLSEVVEFIGFKKNVEDYYAAADVCLVTSDYEGFPMGLLESMGAGLPVVMYEMPYLTIVEKGQGMIQVPHHDKAAAAGRIVDILSHDDMRKDLGKKSRESVRDILSFDFRGEWKEFFDMTQDQKYEPAKIPMMWDTLFDSYRKGVTRILDCDGTWDGISPVYRLREIRRSASYRIGRMITYIPRLVRHLLTGFPM